MKSMGSSFLGVTLLLLSPVVGVAAQPGGGGSGVIAEQNLFHPSRSVPPPPPKPVPATPAPAPQPVAQPAPPPPPPPKFELVGVVKVDGEAPMAFLKEPQLTQGALKIVTLGEPIGEYRLARVEDDRVWLEKGATSLTVLLYDPAKDRKAVASAPPPKAEEARPASPERPARRPGVNPEATKSLFERAFGVLGGKRGPLPINTK